MANAKLGTKAVGSIVKLKVNGTAKEFIVVHQGKPSSLYDESCNGTWLLMKDIYENCAWSSSNINKYESSDVYPYLNGPFLNLFDSNIRAAIKQVKIPYRQNGGLGTDQSGANGLSCKVFLLSAPEVGWTTSDNPYFQVDGAKLSYFEAGTGTSANNKRIAYLDGSVRYWELRSPYTDNGFAVWYVYFNGGYDYVRTSEAYGIRPALILPPDMEVDSSGNVTPPPPATHKTLVDGTAYEVKGGKCLVNGTAYSIKKGRTLIGGTGYDVLLEDGSPKLTWYFNDTVKPTRTFDVNFTSGDGPWTRITYNSAFGRYDLVYMYVANGSVTGSMTVYDGIDQNGWSGKEEYRTIIFDEEPTGDLLTWLQANATPQ